MIVKSAELVPVPVFPPVAGDHEAPVVCVIPEGVRLSTNTIAPVFATPFVKTSTNKPRLSRSAPTSISRFIVAVNVNLSPI